MTYEKMEHAIESLGYALSGLTSAEVEAIAEAEGFKQHADGKYYYHG